MNNSTKYITGLKAFGAVMIIISHLKMQFSGYSDIGWKFVTFSAYFIVLFISISAYTIANSIESKKSFNLFAFMKRRWLRLAPSYYLAIIIGLIINSLINGIGYFFERLSYLPFIFTFINLDPIHVKSQASILGVEWMLPIMFWSYLLIPILLYLLKKEYYLFLFIFIYSIYLHFTPNAITNYSGFGKFGWSLQFYIVMYVYTIFIYFIIKHLNNNLIKARSKLMIVLFSLGINLMFYASYLNNNSEKVYILLLILTTLYLIFVKKQILKLIKIKYIFLAKFVDNLDFVFLIGIIIKYMINLYFISNPHSILLFWSVALIVAGIHRPFLMRFLFENKFMQFLGHISFGMYLLHPISIKIVERIVPMQFMITRSILIFFITILSSFVLSKLIETPNNKLMIKSKLYE